MQVFTQPLHHGQDLAQYQILSWFEFRVFFLQGQLSYQN